MEGENVEEREEREDREIEGVALPMQRPMPLPLFTGSWWNWRPGDGTPVRITVGKPKQFAYEYAELTVLAPWELFKGGYVERPESVEVPIYEDRLMRNEQKILFALQQLAEDTDGVPAVLLCYENVHKGQICHRRWFANWALRRWGWEIREMPLHRVAQERPSDPPPEPEGLF